jgi:X-Pro dipeptidyl-peptidase C-terminal non-catalytic domain
MDLRSERFVRILEARSNRRILGRAGGESFHGNGLIFHSAPFKKETEFDGQMDLQLSLQMDVPDTDLEALLLVTPMVSPINWRMRCHAGGIAILCRILSRFP